MKRGLLLLVLCGVSTLFAGCTYERSGSPMLHYAAFHTEPPRGRRVTVCHAYGCQMQTRVHFSQEDIDRIKKEMDDHREGDNPFQERRAVAYAIGLMERIVGDRVGTSADRAGMEFNGSGDPTQNDCVDEATNTTSYLLVLQHEGFLKYHTVLIPFSKGNILKGFKYWPHWTAVLRENDNGQKYAVDSWIYKNGVNPAVVKTEDWYIKDLDNLPHPTT